MQLEDAKNDVKRHTGRTSEVPALKGALNTARKKRDIALQKIYQEGNKTFEASSAITWNKRAPKTTSRHESSVSKVCRSMRWPERNDLYHRM